MTSEATIEVLLRGPFTNVDVHALHAEAFETRLYDESEWNWQDLAARHSLGWVTDRVAGALVGFLNVPWDGFAHTWIQDVMVAQAAPAPGNRNAIGSRRSRRRKGRRM